LNEKAVVNHKLEKMWKEVAVVYFKAFR